MSPVRAPGHVPTIGQGKRQTRFAGGLGGRKKIKRGFFGRYNVLLQRETTKDTMDVERGGGLQGACWVLVLRQGRLPARIEGEKNGRADQKSFW